jgi:hypothetical protein
VYDLERQPSGSGADGAVTGGPYRDDVLKPVIRPYRKQVSVAAEYCLDIVAVWIEDESSVVTGPALARCAIVGSAGLDRSRVKGIHVRPVFRHERSMLADRMRVISIIVPSSLSFPYQRGDNPLARQHRAGHLRCSDAESVETMQTCGELTPRRRSYRGRSPGGTPDTFSEMSLRECCQGRRHAHRETAALSICSTASVASWSYVGPRFR